VGGSNFCLEMNCLKEVGFPFLMDYALHKSMDAAAILKLVRALRCARLMVKGNGELIALVL
jgi:hypothetical protein